MAQTGLHCCYRWTLTVTDSVGNTSGTSTSGWVLIDTRARPADRHRLRHQRLPGGRQRHYFFKGGTGTIDLSSDSADAQSGINKHNYSALTVDHRLDLHAGRRGGRPRSQERGVERHLGTTDVTLTPYNGALTAGTTRTVTMTADATARP